MRIGAIQPNVITMTPNDAKFGAWDHRILLPMLFDRARYVGELKECNTRCRNARGWAVISKK
jgi:hypothetical protein